MRRAALSAVLALGCAAKVPAPEHVRGIGAAELQKKLEAARSPVQSFVGEARLTYFGNDRRVRTSATLAVARPDRLRYEIHGPHGGVLEAFATNGKELQLLSLAESRFLYGPATTDNLRKLVSFAPLSLDAAGWVGLLFGEVQIPAEAGVSWDEGSGRLVAGFVDGDRRVRVEIDASRWRATRVVVQDAAGSALSEVTVESHDERGIPESLRIIVPPEKVDLAIRLRDVTYDPELGEEAFVLDVPRDVVPERLGP